jgi:hypothetical protein
MYHVAATPAKSEGLSVKNEAVRNAHPFIKGKLDCPLGSDLDLTWIWYLQSAFGIRLNSKVKAASMYGPHASSQLSYGWKVHGGLCRRTRPRDWHG